MRKNATVIVGSARKDGNTDRLCSATADMLRGSDIDVNIIYPADMKIGHCTNCGGCDDSGSCVIDDDMQPIYQKISESDILLIGTPVHFSGMSSIMKQVIDRLQCLWVHPPASSDMVMGAIMNGGSKEPNFKNIISVCRSVSNSIGSRWVGELTVKDADTGLKDEDIAEARRFGEYLADQTKTSLNPNP